MKNLIFIFFTYFLLNDASANGILSDTVIINLKGGSRIIIYTKSKDQLMDLENYDINKMISDLTNKIDSTGSYYIELTDENGDKYRRKDFEVSFGFPKERKKYISYPGTLSTTPNSPRRTRNTVELELGLSNWLEKGKFPNETNELYALKPLGSWALGLTSNFQTPIKNAFCLYWGFGGSLNNYQFENKNVRVSKGTDGVAFSTADNVPDPIRSKLNVAHINIHFIPMLDFGDNEWRGIDKRTGGLRVGIGGFFGYRIGSRSKFVFKEDGEKEKDKTSSDFYLNNIRIGPKAIFGYNNFQMFVTYDMSKVFVNTESPKLNALSFGLIF